MELLDNITKFQELIKLYALQQQSNNFLECQAFYLFLNLSSLLYKVYHLINLKIPEENNTLKYLNFKGNLKGIL